MTNETRPLEGAANDLGASRFIPLPAGVEARAGLSAADFIALMKSATGNQFDFGLALTLLKRGGRVARAGWNGKGMWIALQRPDVGSKMTLPYLYIEYPVGHVAYPAGCRVPWLASQTDLLADDWMIVDA